MEKIIQLQNEKIIQLETNLKIISKIIQKLELRLEQIESEQYIVLQNSRRQTIECFNSREQDHLSFNSSSNYMSKNELFGYIPKNVRELAFNVSYGNGSNMKKTLMATLYYNFLTRENIFNYLIKDVHNICMHNIEKINQIIKPWANELSFFNICKISCMIKTSLIYSEYICFIKWIEIFFDVYLSNKINFVVEEISINDNGLIETLIKYSNYSKLLICYDKNFNDNMIKAHCELNSIEFGYSN